MLLDFNQFVYIIFFGRVKKMKRITAFILSLLFCLIFSITSFADDIYIVEDGEDEFVPNIQTTIPVTTTVPDETTTSLSDSVGSIIGDAGTIDGYFDRITGSIEGGIDKIISGIGDGIDQIFPNDMGALNDLVNNSGSPTTNAAPTTSLPTVNADDKPTQSQNAGEITTITPQQATEMTTEEQTTSAQAQDVELPSVLIVNNGEDDSALLSGSTLTLLVFIAAIVILVLAVAVVLVLLTRRTEYASSVLNKSTIPSVEKPSALAQFFNDDIKDDRKDYGDIAYWNKDS